MNKELEALEIIKHTTDLDRPNEMNGYANELDIIEKALKALAIIKEKRVNIDTLLLCANTPIFDIKTEKVLPEKQLEMYNNSVIGNTSFVKDYSRTLTEVEFELLKEVLL